MRDANLYKECKENGYALRIREDGAHLVNLETGEVQKIVTVDADGIKATVPETWTAALAHRLARMMRSEVAKVEKAANPELPEIGK